MAPTSAAVVRHAFERARLFTGWGKFPIAVRDLGPPLPWSYDDLARDAASKAESILDLDTGGGERLLAVVDGISRRCVATEEWHVNVPIAATRLRPAGVDVVRCTDDRLPFGGDSFDPILNRHGGINAAEIERVLGESGQFLTQQVDPGDWRELRRYFPRMSDFSQDHHARRSQEFERLGLPVTAVRHEYEVAYGGLEDLVFNLAAAPWTIPGFAPERDLPALLRLEADLTTSEGLVVTRALYLLKAVRPAAPDS